MLTFQAKNGYKITCPHERDFEVIRAFYFPTIPAKDWRIIMRGENGSQQERPNQHQT